ncbi:hypothetical protein DRO26_02480 [Candidatus Bathyarchaeota archaeon]|nr:MAG: hypothetical protein DRO26_02480 [Candidatus Bathyarchaeota archaeon]
MKKNDRVMLRAPNIPEFLEANFACWKIGAIPVMVNHLLRADEIVYRENDSEAKVFVVSSDVFEDVEKAKERFKTVKHIVVIGEEKKDCLSYEKLLKEHSSDLQPEDTSKDDLARMIYTSGTTGKPKGALQTHADILSSVDTYARYILHLRETDIIGGHPFFTFAYGNLWFTVFPYRFGGGVSLTDMFTPEGMFETVEKHRITILACVPTSFRMMLAVKDAERKYDLSSLRLCTSAGEPLPASTFYEWKKRFGVEILDVIGSCELNCYIAHHEGVPENKIGSTGLPVPGYECKIVDENFNEVPRGVAGELIIKGPVGVQYWRKPEKQAESIWKVGVELVACLFKMKMDISGIKVGLMT